MEIQGEAPDLLAARDTFSQSVAEHVATMMSVTMNAAIEPLVPHVAFDITPANFEHEYWQFVVPRPTGLPRKARLLDLDSLTATLDAFEGHSFRAPIERGLASYRQALNDLVPGRALVALGHAWMGFEALKLAALELELRERGINRAQLATAWAVKTNHLEGEARRRLLFRGRAALHERVRKISDSFEHGSGPVDLLSPPARRDAAATVTVLRDALLRLIFHPLPMRRALRGRALKRPLPSAEHQHMLRAVLVGDVANLAPPHLEYPHFDVEYEPEGVDYNADNTYAYRATVKTTARLGDDVKAKELRHEVWSVPGTQSD